MKEKALIQLFKNLTSNLSDTFKRWREINAVEKIRNRLSDKEKEQMLKVLDQLLHSSKQLQIREIINKYRLNRRVIEIQRNFLKRLLMSKAGLVVIAFRKIQTLPEKINN
jgi:phosphomevalonate kinase